MNKMNIEFDNSPLLFTAVRPPITMQSGKDMYLWDTNQKRYLDFAGGWAVNSLGHSPTVVQQTLAAQAGQLVHASPAFYSEPLLRYAAALTKASGMDKVFFASSGAEANESAIKLARKHGAVHLGGASDIITLTNSFHGRTLATMSATGKAHWQALFAPKVDGFKHVAANNLDACFAAVDNQTCAIMVELIQGEGGVNVLSEAFVYGLRKICDMYGILLIFDEIQTGMGRTGKLFAYEHFEIKPDILTLGKGIGAGFPLSAMLTTSELDIFEAGEQGGTYCGSPLACAVGMAVLNELLEQKLPHNAAVQGEYLLQELTALAKHYPISSIRGKGLLLAFDLPHGDAAQLVSLCLEDGLIINAPNASTVRLSPPLTVQREHIDAMLLTLKHAFQKLYSIASKKSGRMGTNGRMGE